MAIRPDVGNVDGVDNEKAPVDGSGKISWGGAEGGGGTCMSITGAVGRSRGMLAIFCWGRCSGGAV